VETPLVVLVSRHSASASEIVAGAIQDHDRGLIVGETTFGKGLVQTIMPLRNVRGYALALTTGRYYTPSGRSIQRDYGSTALEDYVSPQDREPCEQGVGDAKLTDVGRKVYGGDGITPDYCVPPDTPSKFVAHLLARQVFLGFSRQYAAEGTTGTAEISQRGSRSGGAPANVEIVGRDFQVDDHVMTAFRKYLDSQKLTYTEADITENREALSHEILEEVLRQVFGEGESRKRSLAWDPQVRKALELIPKTEMLLENPQAYLAEHDSEQLATTAAPR
jgi:carboxyl-terminal processing protease